MAGHDFYVTLPSDSSLRYYSDNSPASFKTKLHKTIHLEGQWEVGLAEITLTHSFYNVVKGHNEIHIAEDVPMEDGVKIRIMEGYYKDGDALIGEVMKAIRKNSKFSNLENIMLKIRPFSRRCRVELGDNSGISFPRDIANILGFKDKKIALSENAEGRQPIDVNRGMHVFYLYTDIIQTLPVGHDSVQLLRTIDIPHANVGEVITRTYTTPHYVALRSNDIDEIEININKGSGDSVYFNGGLSLVKLHFRRRSPLSIPY